MTETNSHKRKIYIIAPYMMFIHKVGIIVMVIGMILLSYGVKLGQNVDTENTATYIDSRGELEKKKG